MPVEVRPPMRRTALAAPCSGKSAVTSRNTLPSGPALADGQCVEADVDRDSTDPQPQRQPFLEPVEACTKPGPWSPARRLPPRRPIPASGSSSRSTQLAATPIGPPPLRVRNRLHRLQNRSLPPPDAHRTHTTRAVERTRGPAPAPLGSSADFAHRSNTTCPGRITSAVSRVLTAPLATVQRASAKRHSTAHHRRQGEIHMRLPVKP
ncbi:hypothetical protein J2Z21_009655 [Streptomyces griseochromogenes]|uniref:Uncharacterized protein n=1 Tax=Streptomyces griseochromogenes TaxID=68214 RepID=A0ABS4MAD4_9ACTN|nr:hypothetical protein [Streptomyces griseochromogenes]